MCIDRGDDMGNDKLNQYVSQAMDKARKEMNKAGEESKHTLDVTEDAYVDIRLFEDRSTSYPFPFEIEVRSGNNENDGLVMNTALVRLTLTEAILLRDSLTVLISEEQVSQLDRNVGW